MRRIINMRIMLLIALSETALILALNLSGISRITSIVLVILYNIILITAGAICYKTSNKKLLIALAICFVMGIMTNISYEVRRLTYHSVTPDKNTVYEVEGNIDVVSAENGIAKNIMLDNVKVDGKKVGGKIRVIFDEEEVLSENLPLGYRFKSKGKLYSIRLIDGMDVNAESYRKDLRYTLYSSFGDSLISYGKPSVFSRIRIKLYNRLVSACGSKYGSVAYCMLTGDKSELDLETFRLYSISGIAHVLAVSGLHIGLMSMLIMFVLKKLRVPRLSRIIAVTLFLLIYSLFVGMPASVIRACIMCIIAMLTMVNGERRDLLSSLGCAFSFILTVNPFLLFEVGFLMSFGAVFGLILFSNSFERFFLKIHFPKIIAASLAGVLSAQIGVLPVSAYFFNSIQLYSVLFNLFLLPIITVTFIAFVIMAPVSMLFGINFLLRFSAMGFAVVDMFIGISEHLPLSIININSHKALFLLYPAFFVISRFFMLSKFKKIVTLITVAMSSVIIIAPTLATIKPSAQLNNSIIPVNSYGDVTSIIMDNEIYVIGDVKDTVSLKNALTFNNIRKIDAIILNKLTPQIGKGLSEFVYSFKVGKILCPLECIDDGLAEMATYKNFYVFEEMDLPKIRAVTVKGKHSGFVYKFDKNVSALLIGYSHRYTSLSEEILNFSPVIRCFMYLNKISDRVYLTNMPKNYLGALPSYQFSFADNGNYAYKVFSGKVLKRK